MFSHSQIKFRFFFCKKEGENESDVGSLREALPYLIKIRSKPHICRLRREMVGSCFKLGAGESC